MANQIVVSAGAKVRNLDGVLTGTSGVVNSLPINASNGIPQLDVNGKILVSQLPNSVMEYQGVWNANTNTPTLTNGGAFNQGDVYLCNVAGTTNFGAGPISFIVGDQAIYSGTIWQKAGGATGTVTSVAVTESGDSLNITGSPITTSGTINIGFNGTNLQYVNGAGNLTTFPTLITSIGLSMPSAFSVANSPLTANGTIAVTGAGVASQYIRGDGTLADFPSSGGGGSSVSYYLNGGTSQGTIGGTTYYEMSKTADTGTGVDFTKSGDGFIVAFLTDANDPAQLNIPAGNWNYEIYASMSANGGTPQMYAELYKYDGTTFTLISTSTNEILYDGTNLNLYTFGMTVPATTLTLTDRLAIKLYATNSGGKTTTVHTQDSHLCQVITTFSTGITALNGLTAQVQYFQVGTSGTDFNISSTTATHTFNLPTASAINRGALSSADWSVFNSKQPAFTVVNPLTYNTLTNELNINMASTTVSGWLSYTDFTTFNNKQNALTLTTTGTSGNATLIGATLNIPNYGSALSGYVPYTGATTNVALGVNSLTATGITVSKSAGISTITFPAGINDPAFIQHEESTSNIGIMRFCVSDDIDGNDYFIFGGTPATVFTGTFKILASGIVTLGTWQGTAIADAYISSATTWNAKQNALSGTGFVKISGTTISYDNSTYALDSAVVHNTGNETIGGTKTFSDATKNNGGIFLQNGSTSSTTGYMNLGGTLNGFRFTNDLGITNSFTLPSATGYTFTFPNATGTIALTSDISYPVTSVFGRTGAVVATSGDYTTAQVTESGNLYYTDTRSRLALSFASGSGAYNSATGVITIPTNNNQITNGSNYIALTSLSVVGPLLYDNTTGVFNINQASTTVSGWLSFTDYNTFNNKQSTITLTTTGTSGAATFSANTLNIPNYATDLSGYVTLATTQTISGAKTFTSTITATQINLGGGAGQNQLQSAANNDFILSNSGNFRIINNANTVALLTITNAGASTFNNNIIIGSGSGTYPTSKFLICAADESTSSAISIRQSNDMIFGIDYALDQTVDGRFYEYTVKSGVKTSVREIDYQGATTKYILVPNGGNVLIGTTADGGRLVSYSTTAATQIKAAGTAPAITFSNTVLSPTIGGVLGVCTAADQFFTGTASSDMVLANQFTAGALIFGTSNLARMRISAAGIVGIGDTGNASFKLSVTGTGGGVIANSSGAGDANFLSNSNTIGKHFLGLSGASTVFYVIQGGGVYSTSATITLITSDRNLKTDIIDYDKGLAEVLSMKPRYYKYKDNLQKQEIGFIAQEMDEALKGSMIDSIMKNEKTNENYKTYQLEWYPLLVNAIKEQQKQIEELKLKIK